VSCDRASIDRETVISCIGRVLGGYKISAYSFAQYNFGAATRHFHFRRQSSDEAVIKRVLMGQQYDLRRLRRASELFAFVQRREAEGLRPLVIDAGANIGASSMG
jgi:hypothetical protein